MNFLWILQIPTYFYILKDFFFIFIVLIIGGYVFSFTFLKNAAQNTFLIINRFILYKRDYTSHSFQLFKKVHEKFLSFQRKKTELFKAFNCLG